MAELRPHSSSMPSSGASTSVPITSQPQTVSIVIPVFSGEKTLKRLVNELLVLNSRSESIKISEILLVWDGATDNSAEVMLNLTEENPLIKNVWLSRNYGQHAATLAGVSRSRGDWIVTMDEDGLHAPEYVERLLKVAMEGNFQLVYGIPANSPPHSPTRNMTSFFAHWLFKTLLGNENRTDFSSFRLIRGDVGRSLSAYCGAGVYLDVALQWVTMSSGSCSVNLRQEWRPSKNYSPYRLFGHFKRLVLSSPGTPLRAISLIGLSTVVLSMGLMSYAIYQKVTGHVPVAGWTSLFILCSFFFGIIMISIGILAEYIGLILSISMGKPLYSVQTKPPMIMRK